MLYFGCMTKEEILNYHLPRYEEIPDIGLFMEQMVTYLEQHLLLLEDDKKITKAMINNYVKHEVVEKPIKKRYTRMHIAYLLVVFILKRVYSLDEIVLMIKVQVKATDIERAYNIFAEEYERCLKAIILEEPIEHLEINHSDPLVVKLLRNTVQSVGYQFWDKLYLIEERKKRAARLAAKQASN